jgi:hypothetical protein
MARGTTESSFDELATGLASGSISRGRALRLMGAALVGGTLASLGLGEAAAAPRGCKRDGKKCKESSQCCSGICSTNGTCAACPDGRVLLSNGTTCAILCTGEGSPSGVGDCPCGDDSCTGRFPQPSTGGGICALFSGSSFIECETDEVCPPGEFCSPSPNSPIGECVSTC